MLTIYRGASFLLTITVKDPAGAAVDLTGATARAEVRRSAVSFSPLILDLEPTITDEEGGIISISISPEDTAALSPQTGKWDLLVDTAAGDTLIIVPTEEISIASLATAPPPPAP